MSATIVGGQR
ncbi:Protein of unknown function [Propionibacterium freudenreichii]|uniref:Uncharacterized protein n=2 Tax=Propionibacterium freudenreichii TaxID=1744 RepID=D7GCW8_PROFC|nr:Hypothetical protein PFREUD_08520 [Propionibacterium freudenreichii subsp. shermanii CIRM-BIA1]CDP47681.1 Protein of unknown function [Propionibacterium freudenreichii subsp. freudenreichii]CEG87005.1 Protein of unknown function [Propionibacterium freudenreichii]CEG88864.1 Protein of unknown function [Propionibacterium freudenreichii]CEG91657.1 Protein of unknown function [Propionibacterium freudenreichii]